MFKGDSVKIAMLPDWKTMESCKMDIDGNFTEITFRPIDDILKALHSDAAARDFPLSITELPKVNE